MRPVLFKLFDFVPIFAYGMMIALGAGCGIYIAMRRSRDGGITPDRTLDLGIFGVIWGVVGARTLHVLENFNGYFLSAQSGRHWYEAFFIWQGGLVFYGGAIGSVFYIVWSLRRQRVGVRQALSVMDIGATLIPLGLAFGRMGCWFNGCCFGKQCNLAWGVAFPAQSNPYYSQLRQKIISAGAEHSLYIHPSQMYSWAGGLLMFLVLSFIYRRRAFAGQIVGLWFILYALVRFGIEMTRGDSVAHAGPLRLSQTIAIGGVLVGIAVLIFCRRLGRERERPKPAPA